MCPTPSDRLHTRLLALARQATAQIRAAGADTAIMWLTDVRSDALVWVPLGGAHPLEILLRFVAPAHWTAIGVAGAGSAHTLDASGRPQRGSALAHVFVTVLVHRSGAATTLMQQGDSASLDAIPEPPEGTVADACRRALGLPTAAPPATTTCLWSLCWLDRLVEAAGAGPRSKLRDWPSVASLHPATGPGSTLGDWPSLTGLHPGAGRRSTLRDWPSVASLHPAAGPAPLPSDPPALARACKVLAAAWPWSRLRAHPEAIDPPGLEAPPALAQWMDDGMWARWLLSAFPSRDDLLDSVHNLFPPDLALAIARTVREC
jgi:hypothetical protein